MNQYNIFRGLILVGVCCCSSTAFAMVGGIGHPAYIAPNASSYMGDHDVSINHDSTTDYYGDDAYYYDPYMFPMYGDGVVIPIGSSSDTNSNSDKYGSQDTYQPSNITNDKNGEVTFNQ